MKGRDPGHTIVYKNETQKSRFQINGWTRLLCKTIVFFTIVTLTFPRWYDPDQVQRVKKLQRASLSVPLLRTPLVIAMNL